MAFQPSAEKIPEKQVNVHIWHVLGGATIIFFATLSPYRPKISIPGIFMQLALVFTASLTLVRADVKLDPVNV